MLSRSASGCIRKDAREVSHHASRCAIEAKKKGEKHTAKEYRRAARMLALPAMEAPPGLEIRKRQGDDVPGGTHYPTTVARSQTDGSDVPTTHSRKMRRMRAKGPQAESVCSERTVLSPFSSE